MWKTAFINLMVILGLLLGIEACSWSVLAVRGKAQPFFIDPTVGFGETLQAVDQFKSLRHLDPLLGWGYDSADIETKIHLKNEYAVYGSSDSRAFRIVITGGSTTDSFGRDEKWPMLLTKQLENAGYCVRAYVGGVSGYNSNQEMLKIVRDQFEIQPQLHISYGGVNEFEKDWYGLSSFYLMNLSNKMITYRRVFLLPNSIWLLGDLLGTSKGQVVGVNIGLDQPHDVADRWNYNLRRMHALAKEFDYEFIGVLQPILGIGKYTPSKLEQDRIAEMNLVSEWSDFYRGARNHAKEKTYLHDFVDIFSGKSGLFTDDCHVTKDGEEIIAEQMFRLLTTQYGKTLEKAKLPDCQGI